MGGFAVSRGSALSEAPAPEALAAKPEPFWDALGAGYQERTRLENTDSRENALLSELWKRNQAIEKATGQKLRASNRMLQLDRQRDYLADRMGGTQIPTSSSSAPTDDDYEAQVEAMRVAHPQAFGAIETRAQLKARLDRELGALAERADRAQASGFKGAAGVFVGQAAGAMVDPPNLVGLLYGGPGRSLAATVLEQGLLNAAIEAGQVPGRIKDSHVAGPAYTPDRAFEDVASAGVGAAGIELVGGGLARALRPLFKRPFVEPAERGALDLLDTASREDAAVANLAGAEREAALAALRAGAPPPRPEPDVDLSELFNGPAGSVSYKGREIHAASFDPANLATDAQRFQYKADADESGVTARLKGVEAWDPLAAGRVLVWEDREGAKFIADGHQRFGLVRRLNDDRGFEHSLDGFLFREADGWRASEVRILAALKNIREGSGSALDAAKVFREAPEALKDRSLPLTGEFMAQARGLAQLGDEAYRAVINKVIPERYGAEIGAVAAERPDLHADMVRLMKAADPANVDEARALVVEALQDDWIKTQGSEQDLFGYDPSTSAMIGRAKVAAAVKRALAKDARLFGQIVKNADAIEAGGNALARDANEARLALDRAALEVAAKLALRHGPIGEAMAEAAKKVTAGETPALAARPVIARLKTALEAGESLDQLRGVALDPAKPSEPAQRLLEAFDEPAGAGAKAQAVAAAEDAELEADPPPGLFDDWPQTGAAEKAHQALNACVAGAAE